MATTANSGVGLAMSDPMMDATSSVAVWSDFHAAVGRKEMVACYGWPTPPKKLRWQERLFVFTLKEKFQQVTSKVAPCAWTSLCPWPKDETIVELAIGIFPRYQGRGLRTPVLRMTVNAAFSDPVVNEVVMLVLDSCRVHQEICVRETTEGKSPWVYSGETWYPDPYKSFTLTRAAWRSYIRRRVLGEARARG